MQNACWQMLPARLDAETAVHYEGVQGEQKLSLFTWRFMGQATRRPRKNDLMIRAQKIRLQHEHLNN